MKADPRFSGKDLEFWAYVRLLSEDLGYVVKKRGRKNIKPEADSGIEGTIATFELSKLIFSLEQMDLSSAKLQDASGNVSVFGRDLEAYFIYRADLLNQTVQANLMDRAQAETEFLRLEVELNPSCPRPKNKQKDTSPAFLTGIVNMLLEQHVGSSQINYNPQELIKISRDDLPLRTFSRRVDGCFPAATNPKAIWEIKEYYNTTSFGSRISDGVYETALDGMERYELEQSHGIHIHHTLFIDSRIAWWTPGGKPYLCRLIDLLNMGYVSELIVGREVLIRLPELIQEWKNL
jgi:hypothetical protein